MKATFFKEKSGCKCPSKEDTSNAQFWNISACSPSLPVRLLQNLLTHISNFCFYNTSVKVTKKKRKILESH